jgi:uncharacterized protein YggE
MKRLREVGLMAAVLTACSGPSAGGQATPASAGFDRMNVYEVPTERLSQSQETPEQGWIQVSGTGSVQVTPDRARVAFAMETRAEAADEAASANADAMDAVLRALRGASFDGLTLATFGYSLRPEYSTANSQRTRAIIAYTVLNNVSATIEDVDAVGRLVDVAIGTGANRVSTISFFASDTEDARTEALAQAVGNARSEAEVIARALGHELGAPLEINGGAQRPSPRMAEMADVSFRASATPIEVGDQTVTASVSIRFALGPELGG